MTDRSSYEQQIQRQKIESVPFREVLINGKRPAVAGCHHNVNAWVSANKSDRAVRGWAAYAGRGDALFLCTHSIVRGADGELFDITPRENEKGRDRQFVAHVGTDEEFFAFERECSTMFYPLPETERLDLRAFFPIEDDEAW